MKSTLLFASLCVTACGHPAETMGDYREGPGGPHTNPANCKNTVQTSTVDPASCANGQVPIYSNRFSVTCGGSGIASGSDALNGQIQSPPTTDPSAPGAAPSSAMVVSCGAATCEAGQVAVATPPTSTGTATDASADGGAAAAYVCASAPPTCAQGESPQYMFAQSTWQCTSCSVVVTYGGTYGNYRRCADAPTIQCSSGQVPTWSVTDEQWECQATCNNGQYDQQTIGGTLVCVPC